MGSHEQSHDASGALDLPRNTLIKRRNQQQQLRQSDPLKCPRCDSTNTKFCYYNNYNKSQPRHFCKACKRHWTDGGTLRNVPVGGGGKNKRMKTSDTAMVSTTAAKLADASCKNRNNDSGNFLFPVGGGENMPGTAPNVCSSINFNGINLDGESGTSNDLQMPSSESVSLEGSQCLISSTLANRSEEMGIGCLHTCLSGSTLSDEPSALMTSATSTSVDMPYCNLDWEDICRFALADLGIPYDDAEIFMP